MDFIEAFQEYFFKTKSTKANGGDNAVENGSLHRFSTRSHCCCSRRRDCGTSSHDLSTYIWHTEGDGVGLNSSSRGQEDDCGSCRTGSCGRRGSSLGARSQSKCCEVRQDNACDASTSTFDLSTYVWGTDGDAYEEASVFNEVERNNFAHDLGNMDNSGRSREGVNRKRPGADDNVGFSSRRDSGGSAAPRKKKRRVLN